MAIRAMLDHGKNRKKTKVKKLDAFALEAGGGLRGRAAAIPLVLGEEARGTQGIRRMAWAG